MKTIDFKKFKVYSGVSRKTFQTADLRESFADLLYRNVGGIRSHALALRIYGSTGAETYTDEEAAMIRSVMEKYCLPGVIDGFRDQFDNPENSGNQRKEEQ